MSGEIPPEQTPAVRPEFCTRTPEEFVDWLTRLVAYSKGDPKQSDAWPLLVEFWRTERVPNESPENLESFLVEWVRKDAYDARKQAFAAHGFRELWHACFEPMTMALGNPDNIWPPAWDGVGWDYTKLPAQADFDHRLAAWLRNVILKKRATALDHLSEALRSIKCPLRVGITVDEIMANIETVPSRSTRLQRIMTEFWRCVCDEAGRLPPKQLLRELAAPDEHDGANWRRWLKTLGLSGLPKAKPKGVSQ